VILLSGIPSKSLRNLETKDATDFVPMEVEVEAACGLAGAARKRLVKIEIILQKTLLRVVSVGLRKRNDI
jgi:hypothetical protein